MVARIEFNDDQVGLIRRTLCKDLSNDELTLFLAQCKRTGLDPFAKQIHAVKRQGKLVIQTAVDGYRLIADRTGKYAGNDDPIFDNEAKPSKATVTVYKLVGGVRCPFTATARWKEYYPGEKMGFMWDRMPCVMLGKCAESLALRKAFPQELSGIYSDDEMDQAGVVDHHDEPAPAVKQLAAAPAVDPRKADYDRAAADLKAAAAESCDALKRVYADVYRAGPAVFGDAGFAALTDLKNELKAKCQQATKPGPAPAPTLGSYPEQFERDCAAAETAGDCDALNTDLSDHAEHLTDAEYTRCCDALKAGYDRTKPAAGK